MDKPREDIKEVLTRDGLMNNLIVLHFLYCNECRKLFKKMKKDEDTPDHSALAYKIYLTLSDSHLKEPESYF